jgi:hypothetical protein
MNFVSVRHSEPLTRIDGSPFTFTGHPVFLWCSFICVFIPNYNTISALDLKFSQRCSNILTWSAVTVVSKDRTASIFRVKSDFSD